jgi:hypothetical protein
LSIVNLSSMPQPWQHLQHEKRIVDESPVVLKKSLRLAGEN